MGDAARAGVGKYVARLTFLRKSSPTLLTNAALLVSGIVTSIVISRLLGPAGRGEYAAWQAWASGIAVAALAGLPQVVVIDDWSARRHRFGDLVLPLAVTAMAGSVAVAAAGLSFLEANGALLGLLLVVVMTQTAAVAAAEAQRLGRMTWHFNIVRLLPPVTALVTMGFLAASGERAPATWLTFIAAAQAGVLIVALLWVTRPLGLRLELPGAWRKTLAASARLGPGAWVTMVQYRADLLAVSLIFPSSVVGVFAVGVAAQAAVAAAGQAVGQHWFARVGARESAQASLRRELIRTAGLTLLCASVMSASAAWWIPTLYGSAFTPALPLVLGMCASAVVQSVDYLLAHEMLLLGLGPRILLYRLPAGVVLVAGFGLVAVLDLGPLAAAICTGLGYAVSGFLMAVVARRHRRARHLDVSPDRLRAPEASAAAR